VNGNDYPVEDLFLEDILSRFGDIYLILTPAILFLGSPFFSIYFSFVHLTLNDILCPPTRPSVPADPAEHNLYLELES